MSAQNRQRILGVMGTFRPVFRKVAQSLTDIDLLLVEESFERLLYVMADPPIPPVLFWCDAHGRISVVLGL